MKETDPARINLRLSDDEYAELSHRARRSGKPLATFAREVLLDAVRDQQAKHELVVNRLVGVEESISSLEDEFQSKFDLVISLAAAAVASSAMARSTEGLSDAVARQVVLEHINAAITSSAQVLKMRESLPSPIIPKQRRALGK